MVTSLTTYLAKEIFPSYISQLDEERVTGIQSSARVLWLHVIDLMIAFDKRIKSLVDHSGITSLMIYNAFLCHLASVIDRCRSLPSVFLRSKFLRFASICIIRNFFDSILIHCQEAEGLTALTDDDVVIKVTISINVAHYFESVLKEWSKDVFFLEMGMDEDDKIEMESNSNSYGEFLPESSKRVIFYDEIKKLEEYRTQWVEKIYLVILRGFDCHSRDYVKNKRQWQKGIEGWIVSKTLIEALDYLQSKMSVVEVSLDGGDFVGVWRSLAAGIDRFIFNGILISNSPFSFLRFLLPWPPASPTSVTSSTSFSVVTAPCDSDCMNSIVDGAQKVKPCAALET
ncbi:hypothetical protein JHK86_043001 [Glycine max]|nr:hypothetical protein JHK86_043001 [Glycine max]